MEQKTLNAWKTEIENLIDTTLAEVPENLLYEEQKGRRLEHYMKSLESLERIERMMRTDE